MRIHELAKELGVASNVLIEKAHGLGLEVKNFSGVSASDEARIRNAFAPAVKPAAPIVKPAAPAVKPAASVPPPKPAEPPAKKVPRRKRTLEEKRAAAKAAAKAVLEAENARLQAAHQRALDMYKAVGGAEYVPVAKPATPVVPKVESVAPKAEPVAAKPVEQPKDAVAQEASADKAEKAGTAPAEEPKQPAANAAAVAVQPVEPAKPAAAPVPEKAEAAAEPVAKPVAEEKPQQKKPHQKMTSINIVSSAPDPAGPKVIFHPAVEEYADDDDDREFDRDFDMDDDDVAQDYFGKNGPGASREMIRRSDMREEVSRDRNRAQRGQQRGARGADPRQAAGARQQTPGRQAPNVRGTTPNGAQRRPGQPPSRTAPGSAAQPFPTRPQQRGPVAMRNGLRGIVKPEKPVPLRFQRPAAAAPAAPQRFAPPRNVNNNGRTPIAPSSKVPATMPTGERIISIKGSILIRELAELLGMRPNKLIADLMLQNMLVSINQRVDIEMASRIAERYGFRVELECAKRSSERKPEIKRLDAEDDIPEDKPEDMKPRPSVVTFLGHVDHGKTSLLDYIRKTKVAAGEAGGITQHIAAYSVDVNDRKITFLDTPGHAAFSAMRARGAKLTDIAVIVIAADDGIMPQTREVIKECRQDNVQMMVAINKCDLPTSKPDRVRQQLQAEGLTPEEWGGDVICCEVSARTGAGIDQLLEMILLQADVLELQANPNRRADGYVLEAQMELGLGPTATLLVSSGTLKLGDVVLVDNYYGRLRGLIDDRGHKVKSVGPAQAVRVMGLSGVPSAGAEFRVMTNEKRAKELAEQYAEQRKSAELREAQKAVNVDALMAKLTQSSSKKQLSIIVKADTQGTVEAIVNSLNEIRSEKITLEILDSSIGNINDNDVKRAAAGNAMIVGFQVNSESGVNATATHDGVQIHTFRIIYELFDFVRQSMLDKLDPEYKEVVRGHAQIRQIFNIGKMGKVAGCQLLDGVVRKDAKVRIRRLRTELFNGGISSLKHFKDEVPEVRDMQEFGVSFVNFEDFAEGDLIECYALEELERTL